MSARGEKVEEHLAWWASISTGLDGLTIHGTRKDGKGRIFRLGPFARLDRSPWPSGAPAGRHRAATARLREQKAAWEKERAELENDP